ncbi:glutathione S-transferase family protein [Aliikangiella sp. IMCC44632]
MGLLVNGEWQDKWYDTKQNGGHFKRSESQFRNFITADGSAGPTGKAGFKAEKDRYHLYVSLACPWAHRTLIMRQLKKLNEFISVSVVHYAMKENGWEFRPANQQLKDHLFNFDFLYQVYTQADPNYSGRVTVPILWDKKNATIVSNESADIMRMFNCAFDSLGAEPVDFYPEQLQSEINQINQRVYNDINNGVYKAGFATTQSAYQESVYRLFEALEWVEKILAQQRYLTGSSITEADWRLFTTLIRFDAVYVGHFKCNLKRIEDFPHIASYLRDLFQQPGISETVNMEHIKSHYYMSHPTINPNGIVAAGPEINFLAPHDRNRTNKD